jgi:hypothetical protein
MTRHLTTSLAALALAAGLAAPPAAARTYTLTGDDVAIWSPAGEVRIEGTTGSQVEVQVTLGGRDASELEISTESVAGRPALRVLYPGNRIVYPAMGRWSNTSTSIRKDGTWGGRSNGFSFSERRITVKGSGSGTEAWTDLVVRVPRGRKVAVYTLAGGGEIQGVHGDLRFDGGAGGVRATGCRETLTIDVGSGGVQVDDFQGELLVDTGSGSIRANDIRGPSVRLDTGSGGVTGERIVTDDLYVDTGSGSVELVGVDARRARVDTGSGSVEIGLLTSAPDLNIDTGSGSVRVTVPPSLSARLHVDTGSGGIRSELPLTVDERDHGILRGTIGAGAGRVNVSTGSGGVAVLAGGPAARTKSGK